MVIKVQYDVNNIYVSTTESPVYITVGYGTGGGITSVEWGDIDGTLSNQTDLQSALDAKVPYSGATGNVDLGEYELKAGQIEFDQSPTGTAGVAVTRWNDTIGTTETTLKGGSVVLKNGVDLVARVVNKVTPNATLTKAQYQAVRVTGAQGQRLAVAYAQANNDNNSADTIGLVTETIATNQEGFIMTVGQLDGINTTGSLQGETWSDGDVLYLSPTTPGALTNVKPVAPQHIVVIGYVEYAHANNGKIYVKVMNGWELGELHDVNTAGATNGQVLAYNGSIWVPTTNGSGTVTSITASAPLTGGTITSSGSIGITQASGSADGYLSSTDWTTFNNKQNALTNPITGSAASGQVAYFTGATTQAGSNNLFWDATNSRLGIGTNAPSFPLHVTSSINGTVNMLIQNTSSGASAEAQIRVTNNLGRLGAISKYGSGFGTFKIFTANTFGIYNSSEAGDIALLNDFATGNILFAAGGSSNVQMRLFSNGNLGINQNTDSGQRLQVQGTTLLNGATQISGSITASGGFSRNLINPTLVAAANNDMLSALYVNPTFTTGAFTGVVRLAAMFQAPIYVDSTLPNQLSIGYIGVSATSFTQSSSGGFTIANAGAGTFTITPRLNGDSIYYGTTGSISGWAVGGTDVRGLFTIQKIVSSVYALNTDPQDAGRVFTMQNNSTNNAAGQYANITLQINSTGTLPNGRVLGDFRLVRSTLNQTDSYFVWSAFRQDGNYRDYFKLDFVNSWIASSLNIGSQVDASGSTMLQVGGSETASSAIARGTLINTTLTAAANNDVLVGLDVNPTFSVGAFTGVSRVGLRVVNAFTFGTNSSGTSGEIRSLLTNVDFLGKSDNTGTFNFYGGGSYLSGAGIQLFGDSNPTPNLIKFSNGASVTRMQIFATGNVLIQSGGTFTDAGFRLDINGTARVQSDMTIRGSGNTSASTALTVQNSDTNSILRIRNNSEFYLGSTFNVLLAPIDKTSTNISISGSGLVFYDGSQTTGTCYRFSGNNITEAGGSSFMLRIARNYAPTSGTGTFVALSVENAINQTGGANGVTRGLYINPTLTSAADWRAIEVSSGGAYINTTSVNASAILQADSTTKGFLPPRMTGAQAEAIATPADGLMVYINNGNGTTITSTGFWGRDAGAWVKLN